MNKYIFDKMKEYSNNPRYPFHMPGHKGGRLCSFSDCYKFDITEIDDFDNLHNAKGMIKNSQERAKYIFGADETFFMVNGSSGGNIAAVLTVCSDGDKIIVARNSHKSVFSGIVLSGAEPVYVYPEIVDKINIVGEILPENIEKAFIENPDAKAVFITSPTYEGFTADIEKIAEITHKYNGILIVDEAHGAHFNFNEYFPKTALLCGADIVIQSVHKTLPSLTQTSLLHVKGNRVNIERLKSALAMVQSSSPSYVLMSSIDKCCDFIVNEGKEKFCEYVNILEKYREKFKSLNNINIIGKEFVGKYGIFDYDNGKLVFFINSNKITPDYINTLLIEKYNIQLEAVGRNHIIAMTSVADSEEGFLKLYNALYEIDNNIYDNINEKSGILSYNNIKTIQNISLRKAHFMNKQKINIRNSNGKICGDFIIPYPPGIPILCAGEVITEDIINCILSYIEKGINVIGIDDDFNIKVLC